MTTDTKAPSRLAGPVTECLACGGPVWDNRGDKRSPKHPDFKCKDKAGCDWAGWLQAPGGKPRSAPDAAPAPAVRQPYTWDSLALTYRKCYQIAEKVVGKTPDTVAATATLFIQATKQGLSVEPKPTRASFEDVPDALRDDGDDLPY
jgi:hypothetical protein